MEYAPYGVIIISYLLGSISFSYLMGRLVAGIDIRHHGSGNAGATNTLRLLGVGPALVVLLLDLFKGSLAVVMAKGVSSDPLWAVLAGLAAVIGHNWPIFFGFKGGKGVATTIGVVAVLFLSPALVAGMIAIVIIVLFRYVSLGSLVFVLLLPVAIVLFNQWGWGEYPTAFLYGSIALALLVWWRHRANIVRLVKGTENKLGGKR